MNILNWIVLCIFLFAQFLGIIECSFITITCLLIYKKFKNKMVWNAFKVSLLMSFILNILINLLYILMVTLVLKNYFWLEVISLFISMIFFVCFLILSYSNVIYFVVEFGILDSIVNL